eukprot:2913893-Lingulodinium_polyedra.AAC.1
MQVVLGHIVHYLELFRPGLAVLSATYTFAHRKGTTDGGLWPSVLDELQVVRGLVFLLSLIHI